MPLPRDASTWLRYGRVLIYVEDRAALHALVRAVRQAQELADGLFGPEDDEFTRAEAQFRRHVARTGRMPVREG